MSAERGRAEPLPENYRRLPPSRQSEALICLEGFADLLYIDPTPKPPQAGVYQVARLSNNESPSILWCRFDGEYWCRLEATRAHAESRPVCHCLANLAVAHVWRAPDFPIPAECADPSAELFNPTKKD